MKKILLAITLFSLNCNAEPKNLDILLKAICHVESNCDSGKVGDGGKAIGAFQIWKSYWLDAKEFGKLKGDYENCKDYSYSVSVVKAYFARYEKGIMAKESLTIQDMESLARLHNAGPAWRKKKHLTENYWKKVKIKIDNLSPKAYAGHVK